MAVHDGAWNVYPFFASGSLIVSGIGQGLYVLKERQGKAIRISDVAGTFGFRNPATSDVAVKAVEADDKIRLLWGSLTSAAYSIKATDTASGQVKVYTNLAGTFCGGMDPDAFEH